jgi:hypothetical protein
MSAQDALDALARPAVRRVAAQAGRLDQVGVDVIGGLRERSGWFSVQRGRGAG